MKKGIMVLMGLILSMGAWASTPVKIPGHAYNVVPDLMANKTSKEESGQTQGFGDTSVFRIYAIYSDAAIEDAGGVPYVDKYLADQVARANAGFADSGLDITLVIAKRVFLRDLEGANFLVPETIEVGINVLAANLPELIQFPPLGSNDPATGRMLDVKADVALLIISGTKEVENNGQFSACGAALQNSEQSILSNELSSLNFRNYIALATPGSGMPCNVIAGLEHEVGHIMGSGHHWDTTGNNFTEGSFVDAYGAGCNELKTVMSSGFAGNFEEFVSDPNVSINGEACGIVDQANNKRVFDFAAPLLTNKIGNFTVSGEINLATSTASIEEGESVIFTLTRTGDISQAYSVELGLRPIEMDLTDFTAGTTHLQNVDFAAGEATATVTISTVEDAVVEAGTKIEAYLINTGIYSNDSLPVSVVVTDNSQAASLNLSVDSTSIIEGAHSVVTITRAGNTTTSFSVDLDLSFNNMELNDFVTGTNLTQSVAFASGELTKQVTYATVDDSVVEAAGSFSVALNNTGSAEVGASQVSVSVADNDEQTTVSLSLSATSITEGQSVTATISRTANINTDYSLSLVANLSSLQLADFAAGTELEQVVSFASGVTSQQIVFSTVDDSEEESSGSFTLTLQDTGNATVEVSQLSVTVLDNDAVVTPPPSSSSGGGGSVGFLMLFALMIFSSKHQKTLQN